MQSTLWQQASRIMRRIERIVGWAGFVGDTQTWRDAIRRWWPRVVEATAWVAVLLWRRIMSDPASLLLLVAVIALVVRFTVPAILARKRKVAASTAPLVKIATPTPQEKDQEDPPPFITGDGRAVAKVIRQAPGRAEELYRGFMDLRPEDRQFVDRVMYAYYSIMDSDQRVEFLEQHPDLDPYAAWDETTRDDA